MRSAIDPPKYFIGMLAHHPPNEVGERSAKIFVVGDEPTFQYQIYLEQYMKYQYIRTIPNLVGILRTKNSQKVGIVRTHWCNVRTIPIF